jgi:hypothetical protein
MDWKVPIGILILPLAACLLWFVFLHRAAPTSVLFESEGNLVKDNPGFESGEWYLSYEQPGKPGLAVKLSFDSKSRCKRKEVQGLCDMSFELGERVRIEGKKAGDTVRVVTLTYVDIPSESGLAIKLYFYNPALDQGPGGAQCTEKGLVAVPRVIPQTSTPLTESIKLLLRGELSEEEHGQGITTEFPLAGVALKHAEIINGIATLTFEDPQNKTGGGACRTAILARQVEATAKQFPTVKSVRLMPEEAFQP